MQICSIGYKNHVDVPFRNVKIESNSLFHYMPQTFPWFYLDCGWCFLRLKCVLSHGCTAPKAKHCKYHKLCCLPGAECRWKLLRSGAGTWHMHKLCYSFADFHTTGEWKPSFRKSHTVTVACNTQRGGHRTVALVGLERIRSLQEIAQAKGQPVLPSPCSPICLLL